MPNKRFTEMTVGDFVKDYWKAILLVVGIIAAALFAVHAHNVQVRKRAAEEAWYQDSETFELPAKFGARTTYSDAENPIREHCQSLYQSVEVASVYLNCEGTENQRETPALDPEGSYGTERRVIEQWNAEHAGPHVESIDVGWKITATITHRQKRAAGSEGPTRLKWLCTNPATRPDWPQQEGLSGIALARQKYGIAFENVSTRTMFAQGYQGSGRGYLLGSKQPFVLSIKGNPAKDPTTGPTVELSTSASNITALFEAWSSNCWRSAAGAYKPTDYELIVGEVTFHPDHMNLNYSMTREHTTAKIERFVEPKQVGRAAVGDTILLWGTEAIKLAKSAEAQNSRSFRVTGTYYDHPAQEIYHVKRFTAAGN